MSLADDPIAALTPREREVLAHIAAGKTNVEIASDLDIRFDTAKWHVSEVLSKLGVDRREDAAKEWRRWNRLHQRWARALSARFGTAAKVGAGAAVLAASFVVLALVLAAPAEDDPSRRPLVLLAIHDLTSAIVVVDVTNDETMLVWTTDLGVPAAPRLSPNGTHIALLVGDNAFTGRIVSLELESGDEQVSSPIALGAGVPVWSPDGTRVAVAGAERMTILTPEMEILGQSQPLPFDRPPGVIGDPVWSADSELVAVWTNHRIVLSTRDGQVAVYTYEDLSADAPVGLGINPENDGSALLRWMDDGRLRIDVQRNVRPAIDDANPPALDVAYGTADGTTMSWTQLRGHTDEELATLWPIPVATQDELALRAMTLVHGSRREWIRSPWRTADGSAWALAVPYAGPGWSRGLPETAKLVVFTDEPVVFELPFDSWQLGLTRALDVVVIK